MSTNQLMYWKDWVRESFAGTQPARETVIKWVAAGEVAGRWLGDRLYIYRNGFHDPSTIRTEERAANAEEAEPISPLLARR
ncbi:hypothetical protein [Microbulbifer sp. ALW1]|uniref:hypothetical protein n=1 Tax=Microbulbifer sp. (strain ALW1) TaxID=1516059 RepID=UPI00135CDAF4|nr:hypothetical protein [Microbulbifer sp. ALW1]